MPVIIDVHAREILDSRGNPTIEVDVFTQDRIMGRAAVPSGASTGIHEALELRDGDPKRYLGKGVRKAVEHVNTVLRQACLGKEVTAQEDIDRLLLECDGTPKKSKLGANALLGVSLAVARCAAKATQKKLFLYLTELFQPKTKNLLPVPMMNILNGGAHADNNIDIQEWMVMPVGASTFSEGLRMGTEVFHCLKKVLHEKGYQTAIGDEGGFAPNLRSNEEALDVILLAIKRANYRAGEDVALALDAASSSFYHDGCYVLEAEGKKFNASELTQWYQTLVKRYPILSIEDGLAEDDWEGWKLMTHTLGDHLQIVGDDLFVTNAKRLLQGIEKKAANAILIKVNQIGTLTETFECIRVAQKAGYKVIISHRSGETEDSSIADIAVATGAGQIKTGSPCRSDRTAKYNQLLRIEEYLGNHGCYAAKTGFHSRQPFSA
ncbi:MAG: phosphopyruvate hydratase [Deltaproteobacteria bacterium RIFCSPLOWO2_02_FULL_44_10]|nr:MAG: phosphopyruvate hydratase [Deltaproteobacteria bacterium RIFCSPHIGHO2_02_FULL_44_16]OGQ47656.1 MAG: phosphopyruvate hydratase [Deltaproteobacteria bacterium RIFCSPLOWO2_02_FULL_44_10]